MRFGLLHFFWIVLAVECRFTTGDETTESRIEILETINNGNMNPDSLEIFTTEKNELLEENTKVTREALIAATRNADNINNFTQENSSDVSSTNSSLFSDPEPTKLEEVTDEAPKNLIADGLDSTDYNFASDEMFNQISDLTAMASENQETATEINIKESINGRTVQRKPTEEELKYIQNNAQSNEIIEDLDEILKSDTGFDEDDIFEIFDEDDEVDTMSKHSKDPEGDFRKFFHSESRNFSNTNEVNITISETEGDFFDDDPTTNKYDYIEKLMNNIGETVTSTSATPKTDITASSQDTTVLSNAKNDTVGSVIATVLPETEAQLVETSTQVEILNINVQDTKNHTVESVLTTIETFTVPAEILMESSTGDVQKSKTSTENVIVESVIATTVLPDTIIFTVGAENSTENDKVGNISTNIEALTESAQPDEILSKSTVVQNPESPTKNDLVTATVATKIEILTDESVENATQSAAVNAQSAETLTENYTGKSAMDAVLPKTADKIIPTTDAEETKNDKVEPITASPLTEIEVSTEFAQPIKKPATTEDVENAETSTKNNRADSVTATTVNIENLTEFGESVDNVTLFAAADKKILTVDAQTTENYAVESATVLPNIDTLSTVETSTKTDADKEILTVDAQNTGNNTASLITKLEVSTEPTQPIVMPTESATAVGVENAETKVESVTATPLTNIDVSTEPIESSTTVDAQNAETNETLASVTSPVIDAITEPQYVKTSTETAVTDMESLTVYSQNIETDTVESSVKSRVTDSTEVNALSVVSVESAADATDTEVLAENGVSIQDFNDITNLVATSLNEMKNLEETVDDDKATFKNYYLKIIEEATVTIPVDTSTVEINVESSTTPFIPEEGVLSESTNTIDTSSGTTEAGSIEIEEASQQAKTYIQDDHKTTNLPQMEPTTTDQSIDAKTYIQDDHKSHTQSIIETSSDIWTTEAGSIKIEEASQQAKTYIQDDHKTTNLPQMEPTTTDQSIDAKTYIQDDHKSHTQSTIETSSDIWTTEAGSIKIEEAFEQTFIQDGHKTTDLPQMEPTTSDQLSATTIIQESHTNNEMSPETEDASATTSFPKPATEKLLTDMTTNLNSPTDKSQEITTKNTDDDNEATIFVEQVFDVETQSATAATDEVGLENALEEFSQELSPSYIESILNAKLEEQESIEDDDSWTIFGKASEEPDHFEAPDFLGSIAADGKTVQMVPILRTKILQNAAEFSVKISKKGDNFYIPAFAYIKEYDNIVNITWNTNEGENNSLALKVINNDKFYIIKEVVMNVFRGNKFNMQKKAVALTPDPDMDDTMPGRTRTVMMRDGTVITFSNVEFLKKSDKREISEPSTVGQKVWHFEVASASIAVIAVIAVLIYYIAVRTRAKIVLREKDELRQVTQC